MNAAPHYAHPVLLGSFDQDVATHLYSLDAVTREKVLHVYARKDGGVVVVTESGVYSHGPNGWTAHDAEPDLDDQGSVGAAHALLVLEDGARFPHVKYGRGECVVTPDGVFYIEAGGCTELPGCPLTAATLQAAGPDSTLWLATTSDVARLRRGRWTFFNGLRWLPRGEITSMAAGASGVWIASTGGVTHIETRAMTFAEKAAHYEAITAARHYRDGFVTDCRLTPPGDLTTSRYEASDNDGLWTALYVCAESFRWAVTGDTAARDLARRSMRALLSLVEVTGIPGFPARAIIRDGENVIQSDPGPNWYPSPTIPHAHYKGDTSSDEVDGHYMAWYVYSELVADADEREAICATCRAVTDHILDHDYKLIGPNGRPTRWGNWCPASLNGDPAWNSERGLNSLEILSHLKVACHLAPCPRYEEVYANLMAYHHYPLNTINQKLLPPEAGNNHSDDELAACAYYPLLQLEASDEARAIYLLSLEKTQRILRAEGSPFHNVIYGACTGRPCDAEQAAVWLAEAPLDLRDWNVRNSDRPDVQLDTTPDRFDQPQLTHVLSPAESPVGKWNRNPYRADGGADGMGEEDGTFWLLPYWMGRLHGIFTE